LKNKVIEYIDEHYDEIDEDMIKRNSTSKKNDIGSSGETTNICSKTRKKRQELSISATQTIRKEDVEITVRFG
jgi:hypothetical protein